MIINNEQKIGQLLQGSPHGSSTPFGYFRKYLKRSCALAPSEWVPNNQSSPFQSQGQPLVQFLKQENRPRVGLGFERPTLKEVVCFLVFALLVSIAPSLASAQAENSLILTVTPPLFQITQAPGTEWKSSLRVVNSNNYDIVVSVKVQDFHPDGETGNPIIEDAPAALAGDTHRMSGWVETVEGSITIKENTTATIPFTIRVPADADPGGHYAALLVSTGATEIKGGSGAGVSSAIGTLVFLRVPGDVVENAEIRDFYPKESLVQTTDNSFVLRFENKGNVHLIPQGEIVITNMWGKVRGKILINEKNTFGNVLPNSTRKFEFKWQGDASPFEVGRYEALATLAYGADSRRTVFRSTYFWVIPMKPVLGIVGGIVSFIWFLMWSVRRYIRKALALEAERLGMSEERMVNSENRMTNVEYRKQHSEVEKKYNEVREMPAISYTVLKRPLVQTSIDLRRATSDTGKAQGKAKRSVPFATWFRYYRPYILFSAVLIVGFSLIGWYFVEVFQSERTYEVEQVRGK